VAYGLPHGSKYLTHTRTTKNFCLFMTERKGRVCYTVEVNPDVDEGRSWLPRPFMLTTLLEQPYIANPIYIANR
jgi:hypothetical protein